MATVVSSSGTIYGSTGNEYIDVKIAWSAETYYENNESEVTAILYYKRNNTGFTTSGTGTFTISFDGVKWVTSTRSITITGDAWVIATSATKTIKHNSDGTRSVKISATGSIPDTTLTSTTISGTAKLSSVPRETIIDSLSCATQYFNGVMTYKYTPRNSSYYNRCNISLNRNGEFIAVKSINLGQKTTSQQTATVTLSGSELATIYNSIASDAIKGTLRFTFRTYFDSSYSSQAGSVSYREIDLNIPDNTDTQPTATMTLKAVNDLPSPFNTLYIEDRTKVDADFTNGDGRYGATITSYRMSAAGGDYGSPYTSGYLTTSGVVTITGTVTNSRGFSRKYTEDISVIPYSKPKVSPASGASSIICARCDANGNLSDSGTYLRIKAKRSYSKVMSGGVQKNFCSIRYRYKADGGSYTSWSTILATNATSDEVDTGAILGGALQPTKSYVVQIGVIDTIGEEDNPTFNISTDRVYMHQAGSINSLGIGRYVDEENTIDISSDMKTRFRGKVEFAGEAWLTLGLSDNVSESESNFGRWGGTGCFYRVCAGEKHIYVAFNCAFTYSGSAIQVNATPIPTEYRPDRNVYAICATGGRAVARIIVNASGNVFVDWVQVISSAEATESSTVKWIDGYIDYWT